MTDDDNSKPILDADMLDALLVDLKPIEPPPERAALLRERVLTAARAQTADSDKVTIPPDAGDWTVVAPRVSIKMLHVTKESRSFLLRLEPGGRLTPHDHPGDEECMVLEGEVLLGGVHAKAGTFHLAPKGTHHGEIRSPGGALLYLRLSFPEIVHR
jgi:quercetin dioxygenase-like cupin family protein